MVSFFRPRWERSFHHSSDLGISDADRVPSLTLLFAWHGGRRRPTGYHQPQSAFSRSVFSFRLPFSAYAFSVRLDAVNSIVIPNLGSGTDRAGFHACCSTVPRQ